LKLTLKNVQRNRVILTGIVFYSVGS